ncbi:MAG: hypothetical protein LIO60_07645, partial [Oscillospiraceae bacterium]|nr:hypothetical protein [Oscillospiraceae bacterium]
MQKSQRSGRAQSALPQILIRRRGRSRIPFPQEQKPTYLKLRRRPASAPPAPGFTAAHWQEKIFRNSKKTLDKLRVSCYDFPACGCSSMVEHQPSKLDTR